MIIIIIPNIDHFFPFSLPNWSNLNGNHLHLLRWGFRGLKDEYIESEREKVIFYGREIRRENRNKWVAIAVRVPFPIPNFSQTEAKPVQSQLATVPATAKLQVKSLAQSVTKL